LCGGFEFSHPARASLASLPISSQGAEVFPLFFLGASPLPDTHSSNLEWMTLFLFQPKNYVDSLSPPLPLALSSGCPSGRGAPFFFLLKGLTFLVSPVRSPPRSRRNSESSPPFFPSRGQGCQSFFLDFAKKTLHLFFFSFSRICDVSRVVPFSFSFGATLLNL